MGRLIISQPLHCKAPLTNQWAVADVGPLQIGLHCFYKCDVLHLIRQTSRGMASRLNWFESTEAIIRA